MSYPLSSERFIQVRFILWSFAIEHPCCSDLFSPVLQTPSVVRWKRGAPIGPPHLAFVGGHLCKQSLRHFGSLHFLLNFFIDSWCNVHKWLQLQRQLRGRHRRLGLKQITDAYSTVEGDQFSHFTKYTHIIIHIRFLASRKIYSILK